MLFEFFCSNDGDKAGFNGLTIGRNALLFDPRPARVLDYEPSRAARFYPKSDTPVVTAPPTITPKYRQAARKTKKSVLNRLADYQRGTLSGVSDATLPRFVGRRRSCCACFSRFPARQP